MRLIVRKIRYMNRQPINEYIHLHGINEYKCLLVQEHLLVAHAHRKESPIHDACLQVWLSAHVVSIDHKKGYRRCIGCLFR